MKEESEEVIADSDDLCKIVKGLKKHINFLQIHVNSIQCDVRDLETKIKKQKIPNPQQFLECSKGEIK